MFVVDFILHSIEIEIVSTRGVNYSKLNDSGKMDTERTLLISICPQMKIK